MGNKYAKTFPLSDTEEMLYEGCVEVGIDEGHAKVVSRALSTALWEIKYGLMVDDWIALGYIARLMRSMNVTINLLPKFFGGLRWRNQ